MDELLKQTLTSGFGDVSTFTLTDFLICLALSFVLSSIIAIIYRITHSGLSYSRSFAMTMVLMSITISFIMLIIGSNLARAFSLVGALSIIRYRNAVKESRDTAFIFLAMAVGMACGTKLFGMGIVFTIFASVIILVFEKIGFGSTKDTARIVQFSGDKSKLSASDIESKILKAEKWNFNLLSSETLKDDMVITYNVEGKLEGLESGFLDKVKKQLPDCDVKVLCGFEKFNV